MIKRERPSQLGGAGRVLARRTSRVALGLVFFSPVSPFPSTQLFLAAGLAEVDLKLIAPCCFVGWAIEYTAAAMAASRAAAELSELLGSHFASLPSVFLELWSLVSIIVRAKIPWARLFRLPTSGV